MTRISVVVATCNRAELLTESLDSLLGQTRPPDQVLVVDDGSTDDTPKVLSGYGGRIQVLRCENGGKARALNLAMEHVNGDYLWIFDDDDIAFPDALERLEAVIRDRPDIDIVYSSYASQLDDDPRIHHPLPEVEEGDVFRRNLVQNFLQQQGMLVRVSCYREVGPFDDDLIRSQDFDMAQRLTRRFRAAALPGAPTFVYRQHRGHRGLVGDRFHHEERDRRWMDYDQVIVRRLLDTLDLRELLPQARVSGDLRPGDLGPGELGPGDRRLALLQRSAILMRRGLFDEGFDSLEAALEADPSSPLGPDDEEIWTAALADSYSRRVVFEDLAVDPPSAARLRRVLGRGAAGRQLRRLFGRQLTPIIRWFLGQGSLRRTAELSCLYLRVVVR
ncbi:MAG: glycosyltransferase family 2 protein [Acidobacteriota bacterium]